MRQRTSLLLWIGLSRFGANTICALTRIFLFATLLQFAGCASYRSPRVSSNHATDKNQNSDDFRQRVGLKIFYYEQAKPTFNHEQTAWSGKASWIPQLVSNHVVTVEEGDELRRAGIGEYSINWVDYSYGRTWWFSFDYRNGNRFIFDVYQNITNSEIVY